MAVVDGEAMIHYGGTNGVRCWSAWGPKRTAEALIAILRQAAGA